MPRCHPRCLSPLRDTAFPLLVASGALLSGLPAAQVRAADLAGNAALTSDYVWRGTTQTQGDFAVQAGAKLSGTSGWYASLWASNVEFPADVHASSELDLVAGWTGPLSGDWALDVNLTHYRYPSTTVDLDWTELNGTVTWKQDYWLQAAYSRQVLGTREAGIYVQLGARLPLAETTRLEAAVGRYWLFYAQRDS